MYLMYQVYLMYLMYQVNLMYLMYHMYLIYVTNQVYLMWSNYWDQIILNGLVPIISLIYFNSRSLVQLAHKNTNTKQREK